MKSSKLTEKKIYIWGTGRNARLFWEQYKVLLTWKKGPWFYEWNNLVVGFIDSNPSKQGASFLDKPVIHLDRILYSEETFIIVTVDNCGSILDFLKQSGFHEEQWIYWENYVAQCKEMVSSDKDNILIENGIQIPTEKLDFDSFVNILSVNTKEDKDNSLFNYLLYQYLKDELLKDNFLEKIHIIRKNNILEYLVDRLRWKYGNQLETVYGWTKNIDFQFDKKDSKKTIGLYVDRFYGGGIEKVVSLLLPKFVEAGYRVVLITEELNQEKEYSIPDDVIRCNIETNHEGIFHKRLKEFQNCIEEFNIDLICFHSGYVRTDLFYELLFIKLLGVATVCEIHSAFIAMIKDQKRIADQLQYVYRLANKVVTVSETDRFFWEGFGCNCKYIPNPIDSFSVNDVVPRKKKDNYVILWVGRIVERPKRVKDIVPILIETKKYIDNVKVKIIGNKDNAADYDNLIDEIHKYHMDNFVDICDFNPNVKEIYEEADVVLITSASESFSNVLAEAGMFGRPVVMYDIPWLPLLNNNGGVIRVNQRDIQGVAKAIASLLSDDTLWNQLAISSRERVLEYIEHNEMDDWEELFSEIIGNKEFESHEVKNELGRRIVMELFMNQLCEKGYP